jgi:hypothetical protein
MPEFFTVKGAARLTGKSPSSIRRIIYPIIRDDAHADRTHIAPSVEEVRTLRMKGENFAWRVSKELLDRELPAASPAEKMERQDPSPPSPADAALISMLRRELDIKNQQITQHTEMLGKQMELISGLSERLREGNVLIASLQQRLALSDGRSSSAVETVKPKRETSAPADKGKGSTMATKSPKPKQGFLRRLFG